LVSYRYLRDIRSCNISAIKDRNYNCHRNILLIQTQILFIAGPVNHSNDAYQPLNPVPSSSTHKVIEHQMSLFTILLTSLFFFPGFAVAGIGAPSCLPTWEWVCMLSFPLCILSYYLICWHHIDTFRHSTLLAKIRAQSQRTCYPHATGAVSPITYLYEPCRLVSFAAFTIAPLMPGGNHSYTGPSGPDDSDLCKCNTVAYSLISACDACQGSTWISYDSNRCPFSKALGLRI
jgi:hypothetical protein